MEVHIMSGSTTLVVGRNYYAVPRIGDTLMMDGHEVKVNNVIWHIDNRTWVEVQV